MFDPNKNRSVMGSQAVICLGLLSLLVILAPGQTAWGWSHRGVEWAGNDTTMDIWLQTTAWNDSVEDGLARWNAIGASSFDFFVDIDNNNHCSRLCTSANAVEWENFADGICSDSASGALAICRSNWIVDYCNADVLFNNQFAWTTSARPWTTNSPFEINTVAIHEFGHALGLLHENRWVATMNTIYHANFHGVHADDRAGCRALYPSGSMVDIAGNNWVKTDNNSGTSASLVSSPTSASAGSTINVQTGWDNNGTGAFGPFNIRWYLSNNSSISTGDTVLATNFGAQSGGNGPLTFTKSLTIPANTSPGTYWIGSIMDYDNQIAETNENNNDLAQPRSITITCPSISFPSGVAATDGTWTSRVRVTWNSVSGATAYEVWRNTSTSMAGATRIASSVGGTLYDDFGATPGVTYYYRIKSKRACGTVSGFSAFNTGWRALSVPTNVQASDGAFLDRIRVTWNSVSGASHYRLYRNTTNNSGTAVALGVWQTATSKNDFAVTPVATYYYWVKAATTSAGSRASGFSSSNSGWRAPDCDTPPEYNFDIMPTSSWQTTPLRGYDAYGCDIYRMFLEAKKSYNFSLCVGDGIGASYTGVGSGELRMYRPDGSFIWWLTGSADCGFDATTMGSVQEGWSPPENGYYFLRVADSDDEPAASYRLAYRCDCDPPNGPSLPSPANGIGNVATDNVELSWVGARPAQCPVIPNANTFVEGDGSNIFPFDVTDQRRYQQIYDALEVGQSGRITQIRFRPDENGQLFGPTSHNVKVYLGYAATTVNTASATFADNIGPGYTLVYDGLLPLTNNGLFSPWFDIVIDVDDTFVYNPNLGDLLMEVKIVTPDASASVFDAAGFSVPQGGTTRIYAANIDDAVGTVGLTGGANPAPYGLVTMFCFEGAVPPSGIIIIPFDGDEASEPAPAVEVDPESGQSVSAGSAGTFETHLGLGDHLAGIIEWIGSSVAQIFGEGASVVAAHRVVESVNGSDETSIAYLSEGVIDDDGDAFEEAAAESISVESFVQDGVLVEGEAPEDLPVGEIRTSADVALATGGVLIDFDDDTEPTTFLDTTRLTYKYATQGVVFEGPGGLDGGAILNQGGSFGVNGHSSPNFLAFNSNFGLIDGGLPRGPETIRFSPAVNSVQILAGASSIYSNIVATADAGKTLVMEAYDSDNFLVDTNSITLAATMAPISVFGAGIEWVAIYSAATVFVLDDLAFIPDCYDLAAPKVTASGGALLNERSVAVDMNSTVSVSSLGVRMAVKEASELTVQIRSLKETTRGAVLASATRVITPGGMTWLDVPIDFTFENGERYDIGFLATGRGHTMEWYSFNNPSLDPGNGFDVGPFKVLDGATWDFGHGNTLLPHIRACAWRARNCCDVLYGAAPPVGSEVGRKGPRNLYRIDASTGAATVVGPIGFNGVTGLDFGSDGVLYGSANGDAIYNDGFKHAILITIDPTTGAGTFVGKISSNETSGSSGRMPDISFHPLNGLLYGYGDNGADALHVISRATGTGTLLGNTGFFVGGNGLAFGLSGVLYATPSDSGCLASLNRFSGLGSCIAGSTGNVPNRVNALDVCPENGALYGSYYDGSESFLVTIDTSTGTTTTIGATVPKLDALAFPPALTYDVYFGTTSAPTQLVCENSFQPKCDLTAAVGDLDPCTKFYWQVVAKNCCGETWSSVWSFNTGDCPVCDCLGDATTTDTTPADGLDGGNGIVNIFELQALATELVPLSPLFSEPTPAELLCFDITDTDTNPADGLPGPNGTLDIFDLQALANYLAPFTPGFSGPCIP